MLSVGVEQVECSFVHHNDRIATRQDSLGTAELARPLARTSECPAGHRLGIHAVDPSSTPIEDPPRAAMKGGVVNRQDIGEEMSIRPRWHGRDPRFNTAIDFRQSARSRRFRTWFSRNGGVEPPHDHAARYRKHGYHDCSGKRGSGSLRVPDHRRIESHERREVRGGSG